MKPAAFDYERPNDLAAALELLSCEEDTRILAGGQSLVPMMNARLARPKRLVDINRLPDLDYIRDEGTHVAIGALARHRDVKSSRLVRDHLPVIPAAYEWVAHAAVRNRGTLCGNLCHADPASEMPALMLLLGAEMVLTQASGTRIVAASDFFLGLYETAAGPGEMLTEVRIPKPARDTGWGFEEVGMRKADFAWATCAATMRLDGGRIAAPAAAVAGVGDRATRLAELEAAIEGQAPSDSLFADVAREVAVSLDPPSSVGVDAQYRRDLVGTLLPRALAAAARRAEEAKQ
ncbi:xanthine dehydrogenase family protein subunit M [Paralimibaculum aggregatum]|uniref:Xanthine dehydrogenase family protein subunit M n=1 Tax=Paralimibaculum aggregatum TaxID=3036245 RepID=A0ABQ6LSY5_9RHOB|nr:xanthine dehydrogenase family protein subunit M [Limibaculum sp. NKW23]GMG85188.1 xanthine dehydrogenase family protein subunit M [Limibaculum sp. NKW23]